MKRSSRIGTVFCAKRRHTGHSKSEYTITATGAFRSPRTGPSETSCIASGGWTTGGSGGPVALKNTR